jgi:hypothetical protein
MNKLLLIVLFLFVTKAGFAQKDKDTVVYNLPVVDGKLVYTGSVNLNGHDRAKLDSNAKNWLNSYFKYHQRDTLSKDKDTTNSVLNWGILEYHVTPGLISIPFYAIITVKINCNNDSYSYKIFDIHFRPQNGTLNAIGYQRDPDYLIGLYKQKHIGFITSMSIDRKMIREYLSKTNSAILNCIASLNKAMAN